MNQEELDLIKGVFTSAEAKDILLCLIDNKIKFHNEKIFSDKERFGFDCTESVNRISELRKTRERIIEVLAKSALAGNDVSIHSQIVIESLIKEEAA